MVTITLHLTEDEAEALHDLVVDADMNGGRVSIPVPLPAGLGDSVAIPILEALGHDIPPDPVLFIAPGELGFGPWEA